jgi:hypothetical protein
MQHPKNVQFTNLIKAGGHLREFNFRRSLGTDGPLFTVDVVDQKAGRHYLIFRLEGKSWTLKTKNIPAWIEEVILKIQQAIDIYV